MTALLLKHHPKMLDRWAKTIVGWYKTYGPVEAQKRCGFLRAEDVSVVNPFVKQEFVKQGYKV